MKYLSFAALTVLPGMAKSCDFTKDLLMITPGKGSELEGNNHTLTVEDVGNFIVTRRSDDSVIYDNACYCTGSECPGEFQIKIQTDGNTFVIPKDGHNDDKVWKNNKPGDQGIYALVIANDQPEVWKFEGDSDCPNYTKEMWTPSKGAICYGSDTPPSECDFSKDLLMLSSDEQGKTFYGNEYTLQVQEESNLIVTQGNSVVYDNKCYTSNTDFCHVDVDFEIKLEGNGNAIVIAKDENIKVWESDKRDSQGTYALIFDDNEPQIWKFQGTKGCPTYTSKLWSPTTNDNWKCYGSVHKMECALPCDSSKDLLMVTGEQDSEFKGEEHILEVKEKGNVIIKQKNNGVIIYENHCYNSNIDFCYANFQIKLKNTGKALVIPEYESDDDKIWKSSKRGASGTYALVVDNKEPQIWKMEGDKHCPTYVSKLWCEHDDDVCYGSDTPLDICDCDYSKDLLMVTNDDQQGNYFKGDDFTLEVRQKGNVVIRRNDGGSIIYDNDCFNSDIAFCYDHFEIRLESNGRALVIPEGENDDDHKVWQSSGTSSQGTYALVVDNNEPQIWKMEGDKHCPKYKEKVWCKHKNEVCHGSNNEMICDCDYTKDLLMVTNDDQQGNYFKGDDFTLDVRKEGNIVISRNDGGSIIYDNDCFNSDFDFCNANFEIRLETNGNAFVIPEGENDDDHKVWQSSGTSSQGIYAIVVDNNEPQIWKMEGDKHCPRYKEKVWCKHNDDVCHGSDRTMICTCDFTKDLLMLTPEKGKKFYGEDYTLEVESEGNFVVSRNTDDKIIYDNWCYRTDGMCAQDFQIKLQTDGNAFVIPKNGHNDNKIWKSNIPGSQGTYALVVYHNKLQIWGFSGTRDCPIYTEMLWNEDKDSQLCYGSETKISCTQPARCDTQKAILMVTHDKGKSFHSQIKSSHLEVKDTGDLVLTWLENIMFESNCEADCRGRRFNRALRRYTDQCFSSYEVKLQDDAHLLVVPEDMDNEYKIWSTVKTGPVGPNYALVDNYSLSNGECLQIWSWNGDFDCPVFGQKIWDCSDCAWCKGDNLCYET